MRDDSLTFAYLSVFAFFCQYEACEDLHTLSDRSRLTGERKKTPVAKAFLGRWFLALYKDSFGHYETKRVLKVLAGRGVRQKHVRKGKRRVYKKPSKQLMFNW